MVIEHVMACVGAVLGGLGLGILLAIAYGSWTFPRQHKSERQWK